MSDSPPYPPDSESPIDSGEDSLSDPFLLWMAYAVAMLVATCMVIGPQDVSNGIAVGMAILAFWGWVYFGWGASRPKRLVTAPVAAVLLCCFCSWLIPPMAGAREAARRSECSNNLKQIALALHIYHDQHDTFPPAYTTDADGKPMHSWRVLILPFIEMQSLYEQYCFDEPWDGPNNRKLASEMPRHYACPSDRRSTEDGKTTTSYVAVVGERTAWPPDRGRPFNEFTDGVFTTLLVLESQGQPIHWMEPRDVTFEQAVEMLSAPEPPDYGHVLKGFFHNVVYGRNMAMADASVRWTFGLRNQSAEQLLGVDNGRPDEFLESGDAQRFPNYGNWVLFAVFLVLLFLPLPGVWIHPHGPPSSPSQPPPGRR